MSIWSWIATGFTIFLISFVPFTTQYYIFIPWLSFDPSPFHSLIILSYNIFILSVWINYFMAMFTHPGKVPSKYTNPETYHQVHSEKMGLKLPFLKPRWCDECENFKPARSHHCSECGICILKMDHHCPWVNTCIGYYNQGHFYRFIVSVCSSSIFTMALIGLRIYILIRNHDFIRSTQYYFHQPEQNPLSIQTTFLGFNYAIIHPMTTTEVAMMCVNLIILFLLFLTVGILTIYQTVYIVWGNTTIESFENDKIEELKDRNYILPEKALFPFQLSKLENFKSVLGSQPLFWFIPKFISGDGIMFSVREEYKKHKVVVWPPAEYYRYKNDPNWRGEEVDEDSPSDESGIGYESDVYEDDDDDIPLGMRYRHVRRGSEGYTVQYYDKKYSPGRQK